MTFRRMALMVILVCAMPLSVGLAQDHDTPPSSAAPPKTDTARFGDPTATGRTLQGYVSGVVKRVGTTELILDKTPYGDAQSFKLEPKTKYVRDGKPSKLADLKVGDEVFVDTKKEKKTGNLIAKKVVTGVDPAQLH